VRYAVREGVSRTQWEERERGSELASPAPALTPVRARGRGPSGPVALGLVTAGTYTWEPAVIQSAMAAESINLTSSGEVTIR